MRSSLFFSVSVVLVLACMLAAPVAQLGGEGGTGVFDRDRTPEIGPRPSPPVAPPLLPTTDAAGMQLVGFTSKGFSGGRGVLNYTLACQAEFPGSRMCTAGEILLTLTVPQPPGDHYAWVQPSGALASSTGSCRGWTSESPWETGTGVSLGCSGCYGGFHPVGCKSQLAVACCAPSSS